MARPNPRTLAWEPNPDGEYNAKVATYRGHRIEVYSDRGGESWEYILDDEPGRPSEVDTEVGAMREAMADIDSMEGES